MTDVTARWWEGPMLALDFEGYLRRRDAEARIDRGWPVRDDA